MRCPFCKAEDDRVVDSRVRQAGTVIRRRRECRRCGRRYTTLERVEQTPVRVIKKDRSRVPFEREKILQGLLKACYKRPVSRERLEEAVDLIETTIAARLEAEVPSAMIGELVMEQLRQLDQVAYVRFASVYRQFKDVNDFLDEVRHLDRSAAPSGGPSASGTRRRAPEEGSEGAGGDEPPKGTAAGSRRP